MRVEGGGKSAVEKVQLGFFFFTSGSFEHHLLSMCEKLVFVLQKWAGCNHVVLLHHNCIQT